MGHDHYEAIEASGGVTLAHGMDQLLDQINSYLENPKLHAEGREKMRKEQIEFMDGKSGARVANFIKKMVYETKLS